MIAVLAAFALVSTLGLGAAAAQPSLPEAVDPGEPDFTGLDQPVPDEPAPFDPSINMLEAIFEADVAAGGDSFWFDEILARPAGGSGGNMLYTRGRALYMYNHSAGQLGFGGGWAYRERPTGSNQHMYTLNVSGASFSEATGERVQHPSHWTSLHNANGLSAQQTKFITHNNVAVTLLTLTNTGDEPTTRTVSATAPPTSVTTADGTERTGSVTTRYEVTTVVPRFSGDGFEADGDALAREISLEPGESVTLKLQFGATTRELPESDAEYERYRDYDADEALASHLEEYNGWWVDNVPYIDVPDQNIKKMSYYRTFLNRFNLVDANIPGNDYQWPVSIEGVLGYNNAIQLTQPMHMQDLKYFRDPIYVYGNLLSSGETSACGAFTDNPGSHSWGNTYEQYIGREAWKAIQVHGGDDELLRNYAHYTECDIEGQLDKYDSLGNHLIEYPHGFLTGNDFDATPFVWAHPNQGNQANRQDRAETAFWYSAARSAAEAYSLLGEDDKADELDTIADAMHEGVMSLWDDAPVDAEDPGHVFKHRLVNTGELIPWKDQQNFAPFMESMVPTDDESYREALRYYADADEFPIMPFYTANQADKAEAAAMGRAGSNNFSNINSTLQAQVFSAAIREYPSEYITEGSYLRLLEWLTWVQYVGGDNRLPNNNEYFHSWNPDTMNFGRFGIHHNILGAFNFMLIDDIAGVRPRTDDVLELWPIDVGWDHFAVNNLRYHGKDLTVVWDAPGEEHYGNGVPEGFSAYLDGQLVFTIDQLAHVTFDGDTGEVEVLDDSGAEVVFSVTNEPPTHRNDCRGDDWATFWNPSFRNQGVCTAWVQSGGSVQGGVGGPLLSASDISLQDNERMVEMLQYAGRDISPETGHAENLAEGRPVEASFTTTSPSLRATAPEHAVSGFTVSGLPQTAGGNNFGVSGFQRPNTIWGTEGSPNDEDWLEVELDGEQQIDNIKLYFFSDKEYSPQQNSSGGNYREPFSYRVQYHDGSDWVNIWGHRTPERPLPNLNEITFPRVTAERVRVVVTPQEGFGVGLKEIQVFDTGIDVDPVTGPQVLASATPTSGLEPLTVQFTGIAEHPDGDDMTLEWDFGDGNGSDELSPEHTYEEAGSYTATFTATDSEGETGTATVDIEVQVFDGNHAPFATASCSFTSAWENCQGINSGEDPTTSSPGAGVGWGTWPNGGEQWMQLTWDDPIELSYSEVYWYQDSADGSNSGVKRPAEWVIQYWDEDAEAWVEVDNPSEYGDALNQYNPTTFDPVTTTQLRATVQTRDDADGVGALQWKVFEESPDDDGPDLRVIPIDLLESLEFDPDEIEVEHGETVILELNSVDSPSQVPFALVFDEDEEWEPILPGMSDTYELGPVTEDMVGWSPIEGHREAGMELHVIVVDDD